MIHKFFKARTAPIPLSLTAEKPQTLLWAFIILSASVPYYLMFHGMSNLHDMSHYLVAGVQTFRDHSNLIYPYPSMYPEGGDSAYAFLQDNGRILDVHKDYPSKLYSMLLGIISLGSSTLKFYWPHAIAFLSVFSSIFVIYLIGRRHLSGYNVVLFIICAALFPVASSIIHPSNDAPGYLLAAFLLWLSINTRCSPIMLGVCIGLSAHVRSQLIFLILFLPFLITYCFPIRERIKVFSQVIIGGVLAYILLGKAFKLLIPIDSGSYGGLSFYLKAFSGSFYGPHDYREILEKIYTNWNALPNSSSLYFLLFTGLFSLSVRSHPLARALAVCGLGYALMPFIIYSLDRYSNPHSRYYAAAIPFLLLSWFLLIENSKSFTSTISPRLLSLMTLVIVILGWTSTNGLPISRISSLQEMESRITYLDFDGAQNALHKNFSNDDLLITNHSLPIGFAKFSNVIPMPDFEEFRKGDNSQIAGIIFTYGDMQPDEYFRRTDWEKSGTLPDIITDDRNISFKKVIDLSSNVLEQGKVIVTAKFVAYKNMHVSPPEKNSDGQPEFKVADAAQFSNLLTHSPDFSNPNDWSGALEHPAELSYGAVTGPGPDNSNVVSQRFAVPSESKLRISATASSVNSDAAQGRLQVNWLTANDEFISTSLSVINVSQSEQRFQRTILPPKNAKWGIVYASPNGQSDTIKYTEMKVLGQALPKSIQ